MNINESIKVLDHGYVKYVGHMGSDETIIEAARMSTGKGFFGWTWEKDTYADAWCTECETQHLSETLPLDDNGYQLCTNCWSETIASFEDGFPKPKLLGRAGQPRDLSLLGFLYSNRHHTPFEMGEIAIEVKAPIMVFREWHRHRTQSYNEFSARYAQMPNEHYLPELNRFQKQSTSNKQGSGDHMAGGSPEVYRAVLAAEQQTIYGQYDKVVKDGLAKEVARVNTPISRYSKMRAKTDVRNWLAFLSLRMEKSAQWEIREYANAVASIVKTLFPRTFDLFIEHDFLGQRFSNTEMEVIRTLVSRAIEYAPGSIWPVEMGEKQRLSLLEKINFNKSDFYKGVLEKL